MKRLRPPKSDPTLPRGAHPPAAQAVSDMPTKVAGAIVHAPDPTVQPTPQIAPQRLEPALYLVPTPIGTARDITLRALDVLGAADVLLAEDTRTLRHLMQIHGIALAGRQIVASHEHNWSEALPRVTQALMAGKSVAMCSDAGTPAIADPGYEIVRAVLEAGLRVHSLPGPTALVTALTLSGLPTDRFMFAGFPPAKAAARRRFLQDLADVQATIVLYESPRRIKETLTEMVSCFGEFRLAAVCRELTKRFEEVHRGSLQSLSAASPDWIMKGEFVLVIDRPARSEASATDVAADLVVALQGQSLRAAVDAVAARHAMARRDVYQMALGLKGQS